MVLETLKAGYGDGLRPMGHGASCCCTWAASSCPICPPTSSHRDDRGYRSLGASGGVASVLFASILLFPVNANGGGIIIFPIPFPIQPFLFGFLYLAYSWYMGRRRGDNVNHDAHFYGALYGVILLLILMPAAGTLFFQQISMFIKSKF